MRDGIWLNVFIALRNSLGSRSSQYVRVASRLSAVDPGHSGFRAKALAKRDWQAR